MHTNNLRVLAATCVTLLAWSADADPRQKAGHRDDVASDNSQDSGERDSRPAKPKLKKAKKPRKSKNVRVKDKPRVHLVAMSPAKEAPVDAADDKDIEHSTHPAAIVEEHHHEPKAANSVNLELDELTPAHDAKPPATALADTADATVSTPQPKLVAHATSSRPIGLYFRAGALHQESRMGATDIKLQTTLPVDTAGLASSGIDLQESQVPIAMIIGYTLPILNRRLALETILGFPTKAKFQATGPLATESLAPTFAGLPTGIEPLGPDIGEATFATPVLTAVYRLPDLGPTTALVGAGGMLLYAYDQKVTNAVLNEAGQPTLSIKPTVGLVVQGGLEVRIWRRVKARLDVKYVAGMRVEAHVDNISIIPKELPVGTLKVGTAVMTAEIAPLIVEGGIGADF